MAAHVESLRLVAAVLDDLRRQPDATSALRRAAWGHRERALDLERLASLAAGLPAEVTLNLSMLPGDGVFGPRYARILLNLLLMACASLGGAGTIHLLGAPEDLFLRIEGRGAAWPPGMALCLVDEEAARDAVAAGPDRLMPLTALMAHVADIRLSFLMAPRRANEPSMLRMGG